MSDVVGMHSAYGDVYMNMMMVMVTAVAEFAAAVDDAVVDITDVSVNIAADVDVDDIAAAAAAAAAAERCIYLKESERV